MRQLRLSLLSALILSSTISNTALAAAFQLYELGTPIVGTAGVGQAAVADDASTAYFNPAGMALLNNSQFMLGGQLILPYTNFSLNTNNTIHGGNGNNAGTLLPGVGMFYAYNYSPCLKFGVSLTSPYGGALDYNDGWAGRFVVEDLLFYTLNLNPSMAYRFNSMFSVGVGVSAEYMNFTENVGLFLPAAENPAPQLLYGQANIKVDNLAYGYNLGVMFTPSAATKIGVAYRSRITHNLHGNTVALVLSPSVTTKIIMPDNVILSASQDLSEQFTLLGELGWANWSTMQNSVVRISGVATPLTTPRDWNNTYRYGLGARYKFMPNLMLQAGASYDSSPTDTAHRLPDMPMDRQYRLGAGVIWTIMQPVKLGASYEYWNLGRGSINNTSAPGVLAGSYSRNFANTVQISLNVDT